MLKNCFALTICCLLIMTSTGFCSDDYIDKNHYYLQIDKAKYAFENGLPISIAQEELLIAEGIIPGTVKRSHNELDRMGGPDAFGYSYIDSNEDGGPEYDWNDISDTGDDCNITGDDQSRGSFNLDFNFPFYGRVYDRFWVCSNGFIALSSGQGTSFTNQIIPNAPTPNYLIAPFWDDLDPSDGGEIYYEGDETHMTIQYHQVARHTGPGTITMQVILYPTGHIKFQYQEITMTVTSNTIGIENHQGNVGLRINYNANNYPSDELAISIYLPLPDANVSGTVIDSETEDEIEGAIVGMVGADPDTTDEDGNYFIDEVRSGEDVIVTIHKEHYYVYTEFIDIDPGDNAYDFEITPMATLSGIIYDSETEDPVDGAILTWGVDVDTSDEEGNYSLIDLNTGINILRIVAEDYFDYSDSTFEVVDGDNEADIGIDFLSADLTGTVIDELTEDVLEGANVECINSETGETHRVVQTNELGEYIAPALHSDVTYRLIASLTGYAPSDTAEVLISFERENTEDFELTPVFERTIEQIQNEQEEETWVQTTGIVIQGTNSVDTAHTNIYIQDDSGWGIQLWDDDPWDPEQNINRGDELVVIGYYVESGDIAQLINFNHEIINVDIPLPDPLADSTGIMSTMDEREGTWAQIKGLINRDPPGEGTYTLVVDDGSGQCEVRISGEANLDLSGFVADDWGVFTGVISLSRQGLRIIPNHQDDIDRIALNAPTDLYATTELIEGDTLQLEVTLNWSHENLDDFIRFKIYRDDEHVGNSEQPTWTEYITEPDPGEYSPYTWFYIVTAVYDEGETEESNEVEVIWPYDSVKDIPWSGVPTEWALEAIYPNPFNPMVSIVVAVPHIEEVQTDIINILGQHVAILQQGSLTPGYHRLNWNATNHPAGLYFLRVSSNYGFSDIRKLMYIK
ncbi:MAG: carboxypeptidase regulatory-like domain-containing protein [Candidatus Electryonea clarkiae]|nr:carboxypeptidase regulatory-like domain-containing protein [Candidatus Electryonea clarkiae]MDP8286506.1 carboxypeptidase regulatory-like domain-containing protein [Candidatus Electryonea clarkiae]